MAKRGAAGGFVDGIVSRGETKPMIQSQIEL
jgi:hypothetical protein